jgi:hypothetical protein
MPFPAVTSQAESDVVVTAMFLGMARSVLKKKDMPIMAKNEAKLPDTKAAVEAAQLALNTLKDFKNKLTAIASPKWEPGSYITGKQYGKDLPGSEMAARFDYKIAAYEVVKGALEIEALPEGGNYLGPGAYTGMVIVGKQAQYVGSTFQQKVYPRAGSVGEITVGDKKGMVLQPGGKPVGYVHGMIQAAYANQALGAKDGITIEIAAGKDTTKMASCFGCTTFMCAIDRMPDGIHLGEGASWSPVDPGNAWAIARMNERFLDWAKSGKGKDDPFVPVDRTKQLAKAVTDLNALWVKKCASWIWHGVQIDQNRVKEENKAAWEALTKWAIDEKNMKSADAFLNALGFVHGDDFLRITRTLKGPKDK